MVPSDLHDNLQINLKLQNKLNSLLFRPNGSPILIQLKIVETWLPWDPCATSVPDGCPDGCSNNYVTNQLADQ